MAKGEFKKQHQIFQTYTLEYLSQVTGYSKSSLCQVATGELAPSEDFIRVCCYALQESKDDLFRLIEPSKFLLAHEISHRPNQELLDTIGKLAHRLTDAEAAMKALQESQADLFRFIEPSKGNRALSLRPGSNQALLDTIDELAHRLTDAEAAITALQDELKQYS